MTLWRRSASPPRFIALKALQGEARGRFVPSRLIVPGWRYGSGQMPASSTRHPSEWADTAIYWSAYTKYSPLFATLGETPLLLQCKRATLACKVLQMSIPTLGQKNVKIWTSGRQQPNFHKIVPSINATVQWKTTTVLCELVFADACRCAFQQSEDSSAAS